MSTHTSIEAVQSLIEAAREQHPGKTLAELQQCQQQRSRIRESISLLDQQVQRFRDELHDLPYLPPAHIATHAYALIKKSDLVILEVDTTGLSNSDQIVRVSICDHKGTLQDDFLIRPSCPMTEGAARVHGIVEADLKEKPLITSVWYGIAQVLHGKYVVSFSQGFDRAKLSEEAQRHNLPRISFTGECLQQLAMNYYRENRLTLETFCARVGHKIPKPSSGPERAFAQYQLLKAMATWEIDMEQIKEAEEILETSTNLEDHPF